jgi:hypothetical protein
MNGDMPQTFRLRFSARNFLIGLHMPGNFLRLIRKQKFCDRKIVFLCVFQKCRRGISELSGAVFARTSSPGTFGGKRFIALFLIFNLLQPSLLVSLLLFFNQVFLRSSSVLIHHFWTTFFGNLKGKK